MTAAELLNNAPAAVDKEIPIEPEMSRLMGDFPRDNDEHMITQDMD